MRLEKKTKATLLIAIFLISAFAVAIPVSADLVHNVSPGQSIQVAINAAEPGDTVLVGAGTYVENLQISKDITLMSEDGATTTIILGVVDALEKEVIELVSGSTGATIGGSADQGFTIKYPEVTTTGGWPIEITNGDANIEISYNVIDSTGVASMGISVGIAGATGLKISNNEFISDTGDNVIVSEHPSTLDAIEVFDNTFTSTGGGIAVQLSNTMGTSTITGNSISGYGIGVALHSGPVSDVTISENIISGCTHGIILGHWGVPSEVITDVTVEMNILSANGVGLHISDDAGIDPSTFTVKYNDFEDSTTYNLENMHATTVVAEYNWWGTVIEGEITPKLYGPVDYGFWLQGARAVTITADITGWILTLAAPNGLITQDPVDPGIGYGPGDVVTLTAVPDAGYEFTRWENDLTGNTNPETITMDSDKLVTAIFTEIPVISIIVDPLTVALTGKIGSMTVVPDEITVSNDGTVTVDVTATLTGDDMTFFEECLMIGPVDAPWSPDPAVWPYTVETYMLRDTDLVVGLGLDLTGLPDPGTYSATLVFWAEASP